MAEIKAVLEKHDVAGYVVLHEPGFSEYLLALEPSWSALRIEHGGLRLRAKRSDYESAQAYRVAIENALNLIVHLGDVLMRHASGFIKMRESIEKQIEATHTGGVHTPHREH